ncbi:hypothetical protein Dimus_010317 [Dionaea muscipula]
MKQAGKFYQKKQSSTVYLHKGDHRTRKEKLKRTQQCLTTHDHPRPKPRQHSKNLAPSPPFNPSEKKTLSFFTPHTRYSLKPIPHPEAQTQEKFNRKSSNQSATSQIQV